MLSTCTTVLAGCARTQPTTLFILESISQSGPGLGIESVGKNAGIGVGPVELPEYLDRPQIITRTNRNELHMSEYNRWAEPLGENFTRTLAGNLSAFLASDKIYTYPWDTPEAVDYQLMVNVSRFDAEPSGNAVLKARWSLVSRKDGEKTILTQKTNLSEPVGADTYNALVEAQSRVLEKFGREVAAAFHSIIE
jgi:uncharacterized lipoprotein YmbA